MRLLEGADTRIFCAVLRQLTVERDPAAARHVVRLLLAEEFEQRPTEEKRAIYSAVGSVGGDEALPELELELQKGGWFSRGNDQHRQAIARCIARIATPQAKAVLERGAASKRAAVRKVCEEAIARWNVHE
jgi:hypothetical protein